MATWRTLALAGVAVVTLGQSAAAGQDLLAPNGRLVGLVGPAQATVRRAVNDAASLLASEDCQLLLTDFQDAVGRTLKENLESLNRDATQFVRDLWYLDASDERPCQQGDISAYTTPHSRVIYLCGSRFGRSSETLSGRFGSAVIIHEMLHALGLGENGRFPTSREITRRVLRRCGH